MVFLVRRVAGLMRAGATVMTGPVREPLVTLIIMTGMKRVPEDGAGMKFSLVDPFVGVFVLLVSTCPFFSLYSALSTPLSTSTF